MWHHVCVNKAEAKQYFEDLSIEVKIITKKRQDIDLIELNLKNNNQENRKLRYHLKTQQKRFKKIIQ